MGIFNKLNYLFDKKSKLKVIYLMVIILLGAGVELVGVSSILPVIDLGLNVEGIPETVYGEIAYTIFRISDGKSVLTMLILIVVLVYIFKNIYLYWMNNEICKFSMQTRKKIATKLMKSYMKQPYLYFVRKNTAEILRSLDSDVGQLYSVIQNSLMGVSSAVTSVTLLIYLMTTNFEMVCLVLFVFTIIASTSIRKLQKKLKKMGQTNQAYVAEIIKCSKQSFEGIKEVKILNCENFFLSQYEEVYGKQSEIGRKQTLYNLIPKYLIESVCICIIMVYMGANIWLNNNFAQMIPELAIFAVASFKLLPTVNQLYSYINGIMFNKASVDLVYQDIKEVEKFEDCLEKFDIMNFEHSIELQEVTFSYPDTDDYVLNKVNLLIKKGTSSAFIGSSGGGKTTLIDIILGLLEPQYGSILVDKQDIRSNFKGWQKNIGYIPQAIYLLDDSILKNVAFGIEEGEIIEEKVWEALDQAQLSNYVKNLDEGLRTNVGERGTRLSGGQRQRIGIARALYHDPEVLIFDEATSALDHETEKEVIAAIDHLKGKKTILMIAHRLSTIENCDHIYKVENKRLIQER